MHIEWCHTHTRTRDTKTSEPFFRACSARKSLSGVANPRGDGDSRSVVAEQRPFVALSESRIR